MNNDSEVTAFRAQADRDVEQAKDAARVVGAYWRHLRSEGVPILLAARLVLSWHDAQTCDEEDDE